MRKHRREEKTACAPDAAPRNCKQRAATAYPSKAHRVCSSSRCPAKVWCARETMQMSTARNGQRSFEHSRKPANADYLQEVGLKHLAENAESFQQCTMSSRECAPDTVTQTWNKGLRQLSSPGGRYLEGGLKQHPGKCTIFGC